MKTIIATIACLALASCGTRAQNQKTQTPIPMGSEVITLVAPQDNSTTLLDAMKSRASVRDYADRELTLEELSGILWATSGQNRPDGKQTTPSAMGLYPIKVYAVLSGGIYLYNSKEHSLTLVLKGDHRRMTGTQEFVYKAPLNIMYVTDLELFNARPFYPTDEERLFVSGLDAGHYCQNASLWAVANGMGSVPRGWTNEEVFLKGIDAPESYRVVLAQTVGVLK